MAASRRHKAQFLDHIRRKAPPTTSVQYHSFALCRPNCPPFPACPRNNVSSASPQPLSRFHAANGKRHRQRWRQPNTPCAGK